MGNETKKEVWLQQIDKFLVASRKVVVQKNTDYVPFYGYGVYHMYQYLFFSTCDLDKSIFVTTSTQNDRLDNIDFALIVCGIIILMIITQATWSIIPLVWLANIAVIGFIVQFIFLYIVYGYLLNCVPLVPYTLMEDLNEWYHTRIQPGCFYKSLPYLAFNASEDTCLTCSTPQQYLNCGNYTIANYEDGMLPLHELIEGYNIFWPLIFWVRWKWPSIAIFFVKNGILEFESIIGKLAMGAWQGEPIDPIWIDCYYAMWLDNILAGAIILTALYITTKLTIIAIQSIIQGVILIWYSYTTLGYMSLAVEQSVVIE